VAYSPDGTTLASGGDDRTIRTWDTHTGQQQHQLTGHTGPVWAVAYSPDGTTLASGGRGGTIRTWDTHTGQQQHQLTGHTGPVWTVAYSPDGTTLASADDDGTIRLWDTRTGRQVAGTGFGLRLRPVRPLAEIRSDGASIEDLVGIGDDVETLAELIAAEQTDPPLAIAVLGSWGSGKSSLIRQVEQHVTRLADLSRNNLSLGSSSFVANVRQVSFNAWHYSDDRLWTGLIDHLFRTLASDPDEDDSPVHADREITQRADRTRAELEDCQRRDVQLRRQLAAARPGGRFSGLGSPYVAARLAAAAGRQLIRDVHTYLWVLAGWALAAIAAYLTWRFYQSNAALVGGIVATLAPLLVIWGRLRAWHRHGMNLTSQLRQHLQQRSDQLQARQDELSARLAELDAATRLSAFLHERSQPDTYQQYRGLLGQVYGDLRTLDTQLRHAQRQWQARPSGAPPLQRIVLYVDDLDRCPPRRVVEVLTAVHLMLALPLFVVVVAVDPRWLLNSIRHHHQELFTAEQPDGTGPDGLATPLDYLDKIFQIPYAVTPLTGTSASAYLTALLSSTTPAAPPPTTAAGQPGQQPPAAPEPAATTRDVAATRAGVEPTDPDEASPLADRLERTGALTRHTGTRHRAVPDLRPPGLQLNPIETQFMAQLGTLLPNPRAAKKLVNLYRLVRIGIPETELGSFVTDRSYQVVQLLLAILVGSPTASHTIFTATLAADPQQDLATLLDEDKPPTDPGQWESTRPVRDRLSAQLHELAGAGGFTMDTTLHRYQQWCPRLARYSFHTRAIATAPPGQAP
jgi:Flp pilus assembly protein TadB